MTDDFLLQHTPGPTVDVPPALLAARRALAAATTDLLAIPDSALETGWPWRGAEADVRYGLYRAIEAIEEAGAALDRTLRGRPAARPPAADRIAPATIARWDLHGLLASLDETLLDRHPGGGEWTLRQTLAHIVGGQRAYGWFTAWWASRPADEPAPDAVPEAVRDAARLPDEETEGDGTVGEIRSRFDAVLDLSAGRLGHLDEDGLARPARWSGIPVTVGFRLGRWSSHVIEHTLQLDKTLVVLGRNPTEVERLVRLVHGAYGRLEGLVFGMPAAVLEAAGPQGRSIDAVLADLGAELLADARSARAAAGAG